jgi:TetR/AcrR family transcriptional regulator, transcriptional repressor for nem operon
MRYSAAHKAETRKHLLEVSGALAKKNGFSASGVDALMAAAGLTSGAFYNHFGSKTELFSELVAQELQHSVTMIADDTTDEPVDEWIARQLRRYLTWKHAQNPESGCVIPSLGAEIARADKNTKKKYEDSMKHIRDIWANQLGDEKMAWAVCAQLVGAMLLARAMATEKTGKEVLDASKAFLEKALSQPGS